jgi:DNA-binding Xre family transcriptional regulator
MGRRDPRAIGLKPGILDKTTCNAENPGMATRIKLTEQIRRAVAECGLTRYRLWKITGVDETALSRFVSGERGLSFESLDALCDFLQIDIVVRGPKGKKHG